jgi:periplasmic copper chaperone A
MLFWTRAVPPYLLRPFIEGNPMKLTLLPALLALGASAALAQNVTIEGAWARATVPGQQATGAFMKLTAKEGARLVAVTSPVAGVAEVHEMKMDGDVMKMRAVAGIDLPAGKAVELKPGGYHVMLMDLKAPLAKDSTVALTLVLQDAQGRQTRQAVQLPVHTGVPAAAHRH